ncbi:hypothetical protein [Actinoallomurus purpureus]|nr:hypothetical protein [Actinoallomurus purpureus]
MVADFLRTAELNNAERAALNHGVTLRRGHTPGPTGFPTEGPIRR